jgi:hypothetical protein
MPRFSYREEPLDEGEKMSQEKWEMRKHDNNAAFFSFLTERNLLMWVRIQDWEMRKHDNNAAFLYREEPLDEGEDMSHEE